MRSNAGMANRQGDVDLRFAQVSAPSQNFGLAWFGILQFDLECACYSSVTRILSFWFSSNPPRVNINRETGTTKDQILYGRGR
jgi:hypothetical protein